MGNISRRALLASGGAAAAVVGAQYLLPGSIPAGAALEPDDQLSGTVLNDASELSPVPVHKHVVLNRAPDDALIEQVRREIASARREGRPVLASAARHSMGGQSLPLKGSALTMEQDWLEADRSARTYRAAAGTRWSGVIAALDPKGFSPAVMQSNNDFGVAATFCVNAHGWPVPFGPFGSTVRSFRMVMADGELVRCSRDENADLFRLMMGGYGLAGIIVDMDVEMVPNQLLVPSFEAMEGRAFAETFVAAVNDSDVAMAYGRLDVSLDRFFEEALMVTWRPAGDQSEIPAARGSGTFSHISRHIYRAQLGSNRIKTLRWWMETEVGPALGGSAATRNSLMNEPVVTLEDRDPTRTDILHEYFVPPERFADFIDACREVIPSSYQDLMNITLRYVKADGESLLSYAPQHRIAGVMSFSQEKSLRAEEDMARMTRALIDRVTALGGTYYLPYRLHATPRQLREAYPGMAEFIRRKLEADPARLFRSGFWDRYVENNRESWDL